MSKRMQVVAAAVENPDGKLFVVRRCGKRDIGLWEFPAGKVDEGELPSAAVRREYREEAGLDVGFTARHQFHIEHIDDANPEMTIYYYAARKSTGWEVARHKERGNFDKSGWKTPDEIEQLDLTRGARNLLRRYKERFIPN